MVPMPIRPVTQTLPKPGSPQPAAPPTLSEPGANTPGVCTPKTGLREIEILVQAQPGAVVPAQRRLGGKHSPGLRRNFFQRNVSRDFQLGHRRCGADADGVVAVEGHHATAAAQEKNPAADIADLRLPEVTGGRAVGAAEIALHIERERRRGGADADLAVIAHGQLGGEVIAGIERADRESVRAGARLCRSRPANARRRCPRD